MDTHCPPFFDQKLLTVLAAPRNHENLRFLGAWRECELGLAKWNPLNGTYILPYGESWPLAGNTAGVQNYFKPVAGIAATALLLIQSVPEANFAKIDGAMQAGTHTAEEIVGLCRDEISKWGTPPDHILDVLKRMP